jgi:serine/threonine-protein kinase
VLGGSDCRPRGTSPEANRDVQIGSELGPFRLLKHITTGGMGVIVEALDTRSGRPVALKVLRQELRGDAAMVCRFLNEASLGERLQHPHIVEVLEHGTLQDRTYIAMELLEGETLARRLGRRGGRAEAGLPMAWVVRVAMQITCALEAAHALGVVHRDLKPENVMLLPGPADPADDVSAVPHVKLLDFGSALLLGSTDRLTVTGELLGTPFYMAPEQAQGRHDQVDTRVDVYALGVMLFEMLTGDVPFVAGNLITLCQMHMNEPFPSLRERRPAVPVELEQIVERATRKSRDDRWATVADFRQVLGEVALLCPAMTGAELAMFAAPIVTR